MIKTGAVANTSGKYFITFEVVNAINIVPSIFVVKRTDDAIPVYSFSRVASLNDLRTLEASSATTLDSYLVNTVTLETVDITRLRDLKVNVPEIVTTLLDSVAAGLSDLLDIDETISLKGTVDG